MNSVLERIVQHKLEEVAQAKKAKPIGSFSKTPLYEERDFTKALYESKSPAIIAEIKKASPSKGIIREDFSVEEIAPIYAQYGASCISVLSDQQFFQGHPDYIALAKKHCNLPILRKDFIIDPYQIYESKELGADCILLIVAILDNRQLEDFCQIAQGLNLSVLVESHTKEELDRALRLPTPLIGINNRSLHHFKTDIALSIELKPYVPKEKIIISESGINTHEDIQLMQSHGIHTFLVGESLMREKNIGLALHNLICADHH